MGCLKKPPPCGKRDAQAASTCCEGGRAKERSTSNIRGEVVTARVRYRSTNERCGALTLKGFWAIETSWCIWVPVVAAYEDEEERDVDDVDFPILPDSLY